VEVYYLFIDPLGGKKQKERRRKFWKFGGREEFGRREREVLEVWDEREGEERGGGRGRGVGGFVGGEGPPLPGTICIFFDLRC
jgi:hypothetical protein